MTEYVAGVLCFVPGGQAIVAGSALLRAFCPVS